ncbi:hypothetical protein CBOM_07644 [Ceraceosorus bombacis]|uniref:Uncharacterized protein n=1 Tax=Ceraceosorus bombacis TaxID=401625 RepID=A0A0P1BLW0_9BASI|nr:hypothetical protein CBOM_07644 [Ceraceosorus bombacis]
MQRQPTPFMSEGRAKLKPFVRGAVLIFGSLTVPLPDRKLPSTAHTSSWMLVSYSAQCCRSSTDLSGITHPNDMLV